LRRQSRFISGRVACVEGGGVTLWRGVAFAMSVTDAAADAAARGYIEKYRYIYIYTIYIGVYTDIYTHTPGEEAVGLGERGGERVRGE